MDEQKPSPRRVPGFTVRRDRKRINRAKEDAKNLVRNEDGDTIFENIAEFIDPSGVTSYDDVARSIKKNGLFSKETGVEMLGALPFLGNIKKISKLGSAVKATRANGLLHTTLLIGRSVDTIDDVKNLGTMKQSNQKFADGGFKDSASSVNEFNSGGSHESNPLGGIPMGVNPETGQQQTVEQGETMFNLGGTDFIFSTNYNINAQDISAFNLPKKLLGLNMADATKKISDIYTDREDPISTKTKKEFLNRIAEAQETKKAEELRLEAAMQMNNSEDFISPDGMEGMDPSMMGDPSMMAEDNQAPMGEMMPFAEGGALNTGTNPNNKLGTIGMFGNMFGGAMTSMNESQYGDAQDNQMIGGVKDGVASAFGPFGQLFRGVQKMGEGIGSTIGGEAGAAVSGLFSPEEATLANFKDPDMNVGQKILGTVPGLGAVMAFKSKQKKEDRLIEERATIANNTYSDKEKFAKGGPIATRDQILPAMGQFGSMGLDASNAPSITTTQNYNQANTFTPTAGNKRSLMFNNLLNSGFDSNDMMRLSPVFNNLRQLKDQKQPYRRMPVYDTHKADRRYMDVQQQATDVNTMANNSLGVINQMGGSTGARRSAILGTNMQRNRAIGEAYSNASMYNNQVDDRADAMDAQVRMENLRRDEQANENYDKDLGAYYTNRSSLQNSLYNSVGNIGMENRNSKTIERIFGYDTKGNYTSGGESNKASTDTTVQDTVNHYTERNAKETKASSNILEDMTIKPLRSFKDIEKSVEEEHKKYLDEEAAKKKTKKTKKK